MLFDTRWEGSHGIGRMTAEIRKRLFHDGNFSVPTWPASAASPIDPFVRGAELAANRKALFYSTGFNPPAIGRARSVFTIHDLIHLRVAEESGRLKKAYYEWLVKPAVHDAFRVLTVSEFSRLDILDWSGALPSQVVNVGNGVDEQFFAPVAAKQPGFPYLLYVGVRKPHKNVDRLLEAYAASRASREVKLVLSGQADAAITALAAQLGISDRLVFVGRIPDSELPAWYRGATALLFPSYFEGFGLPPVEAMAGGTPVLTTTATSLPEAVGDAALTVDPFSAEAMRDGIDHITFDTTLRARLMAAGPVQARNHSWDNVARRVGAVLDELRASVQP